MRNTIIGLLLAVFGLATALRANDQAPAAVQPETQKAPESSQSVAPVKEKKKRRSGKKEKKVEAEVKAEPKAEPAQ